MRIRAGRRLRVVGFDVESRPLAYWYDGHVTSEVTAAAWKLADDEPRVLLLRRDGRYNLDNDRKPLTPAAALQLLRDELASADLVYGHNIRRHDLPLIQAQLLRHRLPPLPALVTSDTLADYPRRKEKSASLETLAAELDLGGDKHHMGVAAWEQANRLTPAGLAETRERVVSDVLLQERLRERLRDLGYLGPPRVWRP